MDESQKPFSYRCNKCFHEIMNICYKTYVDSIFNLSYSCCFHLFCVRNINKNIMNRKGMNYELILLSRCGIECFEQVC